MTYKINFEAYASHFSLPREIIDDDFATLDPAYLKVILLIFQNSDKNYSTNLLSNLLNLPEPKVEQAIRYWIGKKMLIPLKDESIDENVVVMPKRTAVPKPANNSELSYLLECMEQQLGRPVTSVEYKSVVHILEYIKLPADVILMAVQHCVEIGKANARYIEKVCAAWADNGITTHTRAEQYLQLMAQSRQEEEAVKKMFGITDRNLIDSEREMIRKWFHEYGFSMDMVECAYERMILSIGKLSFPYIGKILSSWNEKGYHTLDDVREKDGKGRAKQGRSSSSYDIEELDKYWDRVPKLHE